jgi:hypothetical protein
VSAGIARHTQDIGVSQTAQMSHLTHEQVFVLHQIRNWVFGHYRGFEALNAAWAAHGAQAYFFSAICAKRTREPTEMNTFV